MIVQCPQCETAFAVPDDVYRPGRKARCSQCAHVFRLPELDSPPPDDSSLFDEALPSSPAFTSPPPSSEKTGRGKKFHMLLAAAVVICLVGVGFGGYLVYSSVQRAALAQKEKDAAALVEKRRQMREAEAEKRTEQDTLVNSITLVDVRQTVVRNQNLGPLVVIQGYARNDFDTVREFIMVEGRLLDKEGNVLTAGSVYCGVSLTLTQLEILTKDELKNALNDNLSVLANNVDIQPGRQVHFLLVFVGVPPNLYSYEVRPVSAKMVKEGATQP